MRYYVSLILIGLVFALIASLPESKGQKEPTTITQCGGFQSLQASPYYGQVYPTVYSASLYSQPYNSCSGGFSQPVVRYAQPIQPAYYRRSYTIQSPVRFQSPLVNANYPVIRSNGVWSCGPNGCVLVR